MRGQLGTVRMVEWSLFVHGVTLPLPRDSLEWLQQTPVEPERRREQLQKMQRVG